MCQLLEDSFLVLDVFLAVRDYYSLALNIFYVIAAVVTVLLRTTANNLRERVTEVILFSFASPLTSSVGCSRMQSVFGMCKVLPACNVTRQLNLVYRTIQSHEPSRS